MDIHEAFSHQTDNLRKTVEKIDKAMNDPESEVYPWDVFEEFIRDLTHETYNGEQFKRALMRIILNPYDEEIELYQKMKDAFDCLNDYEKTLTKLVYNDGDHEVSVDYDKIEDLPE